MPSSRYRRHGCQLPAHRRQVAAWATVLLSTAVFYALVVPFVPSSSRRWLPWAHVALFAVGLVAALRVSLHDPAYDRVLRNDQTAPSGYPALTYCRTCRVFMIPGTKHCRLCDKCVGAFDHHCLYLNTCVGGANYRTFFALVSTATSMLGLQVGTGSGEGG